MSAGRQWVRFLWPMLLMAMVTLVSMTPRPFVPPTGLNYQDKVLHLLVFGLIATAWARALRQRNGQPQVLLPIVIVSLFGVADEFRQSMTPERFFEYADMVADALGAVIASFAYRYLRWYRGLLEWLPAKRSTAREAPQDE